MIEITSVSNNIVKDIVRLHQKKYRENFIIVEGKKALQGALEAGLEIKYIFSSDACLLKEYDAKFQTYLASNPVMEKISTTESAPNILAIVKKPDYKLEDFKKYKRLILLHNIKDAGNLGTIIRSAAAFNIDGIILFGECTDEFSPKTIRSCAGNIFKIPIIHASIGQLMEFKKSHKMVSTVVNSKNSVKNFDVKEPYIIMFGSEAEGLCNELLTLCNVSYTIPMKSGVESLNLAVSAGIILYETYNR